MESTEKKKIDRRQIRTKRQIREALEALMTEKPIEKITVKELAQRADIDRKTFYLHYDSIGNLMEELQKQLLEQIRDVLSQYDLLSPDFDALSLFRQFNAIIAQNSAFYRKMMEADRYGFFFHHLKDTMRDLLRRRHGHETDIISPVKMAVYIEYSVGGILAVYVAWLRDQTMDLEEVAQAASAIAYNGISAVCSSLEALSSN
jgi:AcrR family transcriptional regulator